MLNEIKIERVVVTAKPQALKYKYRLEEAREMVCLEPAGSPKWIRWLAKFIPWIKVEYSLSEQIAEILAAEIQREVNTQLIQQLIGDKEVTGPVGDVRDITCTKSF